MRIAINGTGVAGPTLAWWLRRSGHEPVLFEKAPGLRTDGYVIDFWGVGYDVAEKMGILPALHQQGYMLQALRMLGGKGDAAACVSLLAGEGTGLAMTEAYVLAGELHRSGTSPSSSSPIRRGIFVTS
jgi:2-polyprenyl-6-methoxyphenol hydroxylase-like FAD-dependent oxidoreductase